MRLLADYMVCCLILRLLILTLFFGTYSCDALNAQESASPAKRPNIVLIVSDDQHWEDYEFMDKLNSRRRT
jgi:hypothetical protein